MDPSRASLRVLYRLTDSLDSEALAADAALLSADETARGRRFVFAGDRRDFVAAHALLRRTLSSAFEHVDPSAWRFERGPHGKPAVADAQQTDPPMRFNLSHTRGLVACVVARGREVGIDVERADRAADCDGLAARFFHPTEVAFLRTLPESARRARFLQLWTLKEAYLKATGTGLSVPLRDCPFEFAEDGSARLSAEAHASEPAWHFASFGVCGDRYRIAIAYDGGPMPPTLEAYRS